MYLNGVMGKVGFVDITDPEHPMGLGEIDVSGEPTSVAVTHSNYALASINLSEDYINTDGALVVIDMATKQIVTRMNLGGQPDAVAVSPDKTYAAAFAIEYERDEDLGEGILPQMPPGYLVIVNTSNADPSEWTKHDVPLI